MHFKAITPYIEIGAQAPPSRVEGLRGELVRKSLHMLIALVPGIATFAGVMPTLAVLGLGVLAYTGAEYARINGRHVVLISSITVLASRPRDRGHFVAGPVTLGVGAMLALLLYPAPAAFLAIYALAFGDGIASLVGRAFGRVQLLPGTTFEGSLACLVAVFAASLALTDDVAVSLVVAVAATVLEAIPTDDMDNIILPVGVGLIATALMGV
ncbi:MAG: diacylglycerol/polyprenol kinase family protein [Spirochaetota bacterium]